MTAPQKISTELGMRMRQIRHDLHRHPELGFAESRTAGLIAEQLRSLGLEVQDCIGGTGIVGILKCGEGTGRIGMRAELDALPITEENDFGYSSTDDGKMHACGHDGHMAMLLGAAHHLSEARNFDGTATFIFQPDEENGRGARAMIADGLFERFPVDAVYSLHNLPGLDAGCIAVTHGPIMACEDTFEIIITGKGAHAAMPNKGIDPIVIGAEIVSALQTIVSREMDPVENAVVSVTDFKTSGGRNVIPGTVTLSGDARAFRPEIQDKVEAAIRRIARGICEAHGAACDVGYNREFAATINALREADILADVGDAVGGNRPAIRNCPPLMASEDFGLMLQERPGAYCFLGNGTDGASGRPLHNPGYDFNDDILVAGAGFWVHLVETQLHG